MGRRRPSLSSSVTPNFLPRRSRSSHFLSLFYLPFLLLLSRLAFCDFALTGTARKFISSPKTLLYLAVYSGPWDSLVRHTIAIAIASHRRQRALNNITLSTQVTEGVNLGADTPKTSAASTGNRMSITYARGRRWKGKERELESRDEGTGGAGGIVLPLDIVGTGIYDV